MRFLMTAAIRHQLGANGVFFLDPLGAIGVYYWQCQQGSSTVAETPLFVSQAERVWSDAEREEFVDFIAGNPEAGDLIRETGGVRKVRWSRAGSGKRGGVRVIYLLLSQRQSAAVSGAGLRQDHAGGFVG
jgi:hypothetical protein